MGSKWPTVIAVLGLLALAGFGLLSLKRSNAARKQGHAACLAAGHDPGVCDASVQTNHGACLDLTYEGGSRFSRGAGLNEAEYVQCVLDGPQAFKAAMVARREAEEANRR